MWLYEEETWLEVVCPKAGSMGVNAQRLRCVSKLLHGRRGVSRRRLRRGSETKLEGVNARGAAYAPKFLRRRCRRIHDTLPRSQDSSRLRLALRYGTRIAPQPPSPRTRRHNPQKPWPMLRPRRSTHALELPAHAKLAPHKGDARYLVYLYLDMKIGVARPEMIELGA